MPIYEYRCEGCGHELEAIQKFNDPVLTDCPACSTAQLKKLVSAAGFQLKGTGWYVTDYAKKSKKCCKHAFYMLQFLQICNMLLKYTGVEEAETKNF